MTIRIQKHDSGFVAHALFVDECGPRSMGTAPQLNEAAAREQLERILATLPPCVQSLVMAQ